MINIPEDLKTAFLTDGYIKNYSLHFPNGEHADITNDDIVQGSVSFQESLCSQDEIKFGLCEASIFQCTVSDIPNIEGAEVEISIGIKGYGNIIIGNPFSNVYIERFSSPDNCRLTYTVSGGIPPYNPKKIVVDRSPSSNFFIKYRVDFGASSPEEFETAEALDFLFPILNSKNEIIVGLNAKTNKSGDSYEGIAYVTDADVKETFLNNNSLRMRGRHTFIDITGSGVWGDISITEINFSGSYTKSNEIIYGSVKLGTFYIDSCQKQADMSKRKLVCYTNEPKWASGISEIEKVKQDALVQKQDDYIFDVYNYCVSNRIIGLGDIYLPSFKPITGVWTTGTDEATFSIKNETTIEGIITKPLWSVYLRKITTKYTLPNTDKLYRFKRKNKISSYAGLVDKILNDVKEHDPSHSWQLFNFTFAKMAEVENLTRESIDGSNDFIYFTEKGTAGSSAKTGTVSVHLSDGDVFSPYINRTDGAAAPYIITSEKIAVEIKYFNWQSQYEPYMNYEVVMSEVELSEVSDDHPVIRQSVARKSDIKSVGGAGAQGFNLDKGAIASRDLIEGFLEWMGLIGKYGRDGMFELVDLGNRYNLYPSTTLYPSEDLYPSGTDGYSVPTQYTSAWYDDELSKPYGRVCATYKSVDSTGKETEVWAYYDMVDDYSENPGKYQEYSLSDNYLIRKMYFTSAQIAELLSRIGETIKNVRYMRCDINGIGQPWIESGDTVAIETTDGDIIKTVILNRVMKGEQLLQDNYLSY